jgi:hypothetical protein
MSHNRLLYHIDLPKSGGDVTQPIMAVQGWVAFAPDLRLMSAALITNGAPISLNLTTRPDVADAFPGRATLDMSTRCVYCFRPRCSLHLKAT